MKGFLEIICNETRETVHSWCYCPVGHVIVPSGWLFALNHNLKVIRPTFHPAVLGVSLLVISTCILKMKTFLQTYPVEITQNVSATLVLPGRSKAQRKSPCFPMKLGLGINVFRTAFHLALKLAKTCWNDCHCWTFKKQGNWISRMFPALASSMAKTSKHISFQNKFI